MPFLSHIFFKKDSGKTCLEILFLLLYPPLHFVITLKECKQALLEACAYCINLC